MLRILMIIGIVLLVFWLLSLLFNFISGPFLWIILVVAIILLIIWLFQRLRSR